MSQRQIDHQVTLPPCAAGHTPRHMLDHRGLTRGGGHFLECPCRKTTRHAGIDAALDEWATLNNKRRHRTPRNAVTSPQADAGDNVLQFPLFDRSAS